MLDTHLHDSSVILGHVHSSHLFLGSADLHTFVVDPRLGIESAVGYLRILSRACEKELDQELKGYSHVIKVMMGLSAIFSSSARFALRHAAKASPCPMSKAFISTNQHNVPSLLTLATVRPEQLDAILQHSATLKHRAKFTAMGLSDIESSLDKKTIALIFSKRSTRTRVASESSIAALGGHAMFLSPSDIQLGVNESLYDTAFVVSSMVDGIMARVGGHNEIEILARNSKVPVINALSSLFHPTQILADLLTILEVGGVQGPLPLLQTLAGKKIAWVGDSNNILNEMLVTYPRLGVHVSVAAPQGAAYERNPVVWDLMTHGLKTLPQHMPRGEVEWCHDPVRAVKDADYIVTDTWISMGDEAQKDQRLRDFAGFQVTEELARRGGAKSDWKFLHCLPRKAEEVSDEVFYGPRSLVFPEAENRKWTIMACFDWLFGRREL